MTGSDIALILCAHGVDGRPGSAADHARAIAARGLFATVDAACLSGTPDIVATLDRVATPRIVVVPFLMAAGRAFRILLPERVAASRRAADTVLAEPVGTHRDVAALIASKAAALAGRRHWALDAGELVIAAHGTKRDPESGAAARLHAEAIVRTRRFARVEAGYLDEPPTIDELLARRAARFAVGVGLFADAGPHGGGDAGAAFAGLADAAYAGPVGPDPALTDIVLDRARAALAGRWAGAGF